MGIFSASIGDEKEENGQRYAYGWCHNCYGIKYAVAISYEGNISAQKPRLKCHICNGKGKLWHGPLAKDAKLDEQWLSIGTCGRGHFLVFDSRSPEETRYVPRFGTDDPIIQQSSSNSSSSRSDPGPGICYSKGGSNSCSHSWSYSHKGVDGRSIYTCSKCDRQEKRM